MLQLPMKLKLVACLGALSTTICAQYLPIVDLGYGLHQALSYNETGNFYNFNNIRYAAPPIGNLRFRAPKAPAVDRRTVDNGSISRICPQAPPSWISNVGWIAQYLTGQNITLTQAQVNAVNASVNATDVPAQVATATEDCLFLDVAVPKKIFDKQADSKGAAVMVWIYGGGYTEGSKGGTYNPAGLLKRSQTHGREGVIYVALNYRLGAFGWLAGPTLQSDGVANAGLYDQRFALEWVQQYIHLFGGDPTRVTVFGESAGGGSIMHQVTAYGGQEGAPFAQAIMQSPGFLPQTSNYQLEAQFNDFLSYANVSSLDELRALSSSALISANYDQVWHSRFGQFTYGPAVDGDFVPAMPGKLLLQGDYNTGVRIMVGHNLDEGLLFSDPLITTDAEWVAYVASIFPEATPEVINYITETLYPPVFTGEYGYTNEIARSALLSSELSFTCNTYYFDRAKNGKDYSYYFTIFPGLHGSDIPYSFYNGGLASSSVLNTTAAVALQDWLVTYAESGKPSTPDVSGAPKFVMWGSNSTVEDLGLNAITHVVDPTANARCAWWQLALYE